MANAHTRFNARAHSGVITARYRTCVFLFRVCVFTRIHASVFVHARRRNRIGMLVAKRYRNAYTRANRRAITLGADVGVQLMCEYVCILLYTSVRTSGWYIFMMERVLGGWMCTTKQWHRKRWRGKGVYLQSKWCDVALSGNSSHVRD